MEVTERLAIIEACRALIYRYAYLNDERDYGALADLFTEDAVFCRPSAPDKPIIGRDAILASFNARPTDLVTFHMTSDVLIEVESSERARARSRILLFSSPRSPDGARPDMARTAPPLQGMLRDSLSLTAAGWKFSQRVGALWLPSVRSR
ncbi:MAG: nuclear transport factor 2 family protein [Steroidobacterales bacterium]